MIEGLFGHKLHFYLEHKLQHKLEGNEECPRLVWERLLLLY